MTTPHPTSPRATRSLDLSTPAEVETFERAFYQAFIHATHNRLIHQLWDWDHPNHRLRTRIPYPHQRIYTLHHPDGPIRAAIAVNLPLLHLQAAAFGFSLPARLLPPAHTESICEFLTFFTLHTPRLSQTLPLWRETFLDLRQAGFSHAVATTSPRILPLYRWMHAEILGETRINNETRLFLLFNLAIHHHHRHHHRPAPSPSATSKQVPQLFTISPPPNPTREPDPAHAKSGHPNQPAR